MERKQYQKEREKEGAIWRKEKTVQKYFPELNNKDMNLWIERVPKTGMKDKNK